MEHGTDLPGEGEVGVVLADRRPLASRAVVAGEDGLHGAGTCSATADLNANDGGHHHVTAPAVRLREQGP